MSNTTIQSSSSSTSSTSQNNSNTSNVEQAKKSPFDLSVSTINDLSTPVGGSGTSTPIEKREVSQFSDEISEKNPNSTCSEVMYGQICSTIKGLTVELSEKWGLYKLAQEDVEKEKLILQKHKEHFDQDVIKHKEEVALFEKAVESSKQSLASSLEGNLQKVSNGKDDPLTIALFAIKHKLPMLEQKFQELLKADTTENRAKFVQLYTAEIRSVLANAQITAQKLAKESDKAPTLDDLKKSLEKSFISTMFSAQASKETLQFIELSIKNAKDESTAGAPLSKAAWALSLLRSLNPYIPAFGLAYVAGRSQEALLAIAPERINDLICGIQEYVGSPTVPLLCFAVAYIMYYLVQLGYLGKDRYFPTTPEVKESQRNVALIGAFSRA